MEAKHTDEPSAAEQDAFFAQIAAEEKRKLDAHDDLLWIAKTLEKMDEKEGLSPTALGYLRDRAVAAIAKATGAA